jgi:hypothetical protein
MMGGYEYSAKHAKNAKAKTKATSQAMPDDTPHNPPSMTTTSDKPPLIEVSDDEE